MKTHYGLSLECVFRRSHRANVCASAGGRPPRRHAVRARACRPSHQQHRRIHCEERILSAGCHGPAHNVRAPARCFLRFPLLHCVSFSYVPEQALPKWYYCRWGRWAPELLNEDMDWNNQRGVNSVQILSFLLSAYHYSGDATFLVHFDSLVNDYGYALNMVSASCCVVFSAMCSAEIRRSQTLY